MSNSYYFIILPLKCTKDEEKKKKKQAKHKNKNAAMVYGKKTFHNENKLIHTNYIQFTS